MSKNIDKVLEITNDELDFINAYINLRTILRSENFTEESIKNVSSASNEIWLAHHLLQTEIKDLKKKLVTFWGFTNEEINEYLTKKMSEINKSIPLNDGNTE